MLRNVVSVMAFMILCVLLSVSSGCTDQSSDFDLDMLAGENFLVAATAGGGSGSYAIQRPNGLVYKDLCAFNTTDVGVTVHDNAIFIYGKYDADWIARFELDSSEDPLYQYSTVEGSEGTMNPRDVVIVNDDVGYVLRYGSNISWIIDPSPADEASFKIGEIDLSAYETSGTDWDDNPAMFPPNPVQGLIDGNTMYLLLERTNNWEYDVKALLVTVDISTPSSPVIDGSHELIVRSPNKMCLLGDHLYIAGWGDPYDMAGSIPNGGVEEVDLSGGVGSYTSTLIIDDGTDSAGAAYTYGGYTKNIAVLSSTQAFVQIYDADMWGDVFVSKLHPFNPGTETIDDTIAILDGVDMSDMAAAPDGDLTVSGAYGYGLEMEPGLYSVDTTTYDTYGPVSTGLEPVDIEYNW